MKFLIFLLLVTISAIHAAKYTGPTNQAGVNLIKEFEGFRANFYNDPVGIRTIGYGHACHSNSCRVPLNGKYPVPLSRANGEALLKDDLKKSGGFESCVRNAVTYSNLNANQYSALVSFAFNLGCGALRGSTLLSKLNRGDVRGSSEEFGKWVHAGGQRLPGLVRRREAEKALFCTGGTCGSSPSSCTGRATTGLNIRASPNTNAGIVGSLANGETRTITGRSTGTNVNGNRNWFKISNGYVSAYYMNIASSNGASYCKKT